MGLISWIKGLFDKTIKSSKSGKELVFLATKSSTKIGTDIEIKPGYVGVVVAKGVVCDVFQEGRYRLEPKELPLASRKINFTKPNKKGELPKKFNADIYFVNLNLFEDKFRSKNFVKASGDGFKNLKLNLVGQYSFKVVNPVDFLEALLTQFGIIADQIAKEEVAEWVSTLCVRAVQKNKPTIKELFEKDNRCFAGVGEYVNSDLYDCGIRLEYLEIIGAEFPKKIHKYLSQTYYLNSDNKPENPVEFANQKSFESQSDRVYNQEAKEIEADMSKSTYQFDSAGGSQIDNIGGEIYSTPISSFEELEGIDNNLNNSAEKPLQDYFNNDNSNNQTESTNQNQTEYENQSEKSQTENQNEYYANNQNNQTNIRPIKKTITYKKCPVCGAINADDAHTCFACKNSFDD